MQKFIDKIDQFNLTLGRSVAWLALAMVLLTALTVVQRYIFATNFIWQSELIIYFHSILFLASAGYTLQTGSHVRVDVFYERMSERKQACFDLFGTIFFLIPVAIAIAYFSYDFIINSWSIYEGSREYNGLPAIYLLKSGIWLFSATLILQAISLIYKNISKLII